MSRALACNCSQRSRYVHRWGVDPFWILGARLHIGGGWGPEYPAGSRGRATVGGLEDRVPEADMIFLEMCSEFLVIFLASTVWKKYIGAKQYACSNICGTKYVIDWSSPSSSWLMAQLQTANAGEGERCHWEKKIRPTALQNAISKITLYWYRKITRA